MATVEEKKKKPMSFARHETFYIRDGWLRKGMKLVEKKGFGFFRQDEAPETLGMGKNMVQSLRFWLQATRLVEPKKENKIEHELSEYGQIVFDMDTYFEDIGTLWLIHYNLATNKELSTTWYWFFNIFNHKEFDEPTFLYWLKNFAIVEGAKVAESSFKKDFQCFINSYLFESKLKYHNSPEDNINCPLRNLKLLKNTGLKTYKMNNVNRNSLHPLIVFYIIKKWQEEFQRPLEITISDLTESHWKDGIKYNVSKALSLSYEDVIYYLEECQELDMLTLSRTAGLDSVMLKDIYSGDVLRKYYQLVKGGEACE